MKIDLSDESALDCGNIFATDCEGRIPFLEGWRECRKRFESIMEQESNAMDARRKTAVVSECRKRFESIMEQESNAMDAEKRRL